MRSAAGVGVWFVAAGVALHGQSAIGTPHPEDARPWLVLSAALGALSIYLLGAQREPACDVAQPMPVERRLSRLLVLGYGLVCSVAATLVLLLRGSNQTATWVWIIGLLATVIGAAAWGRELGAVGWRLPRQVKRSTALEAGALVIVLILAVLLRLPDLARVPPNVHGDEADVGLIARDILSGKMPPVFATAPAAEATALTFTFHAASMKVFGDDLFGLRIASVIEGVLTVLLLYMFARRLWGPRAALIGATLMAVAAWHIQFSRTGFHYMQAPLATLLTFYFLIRGLQQGRMLDWVLCGFAIGLCIDVYYAARLAPVVLVLYLAYRAWRERGFFRAHGLGMLGMLFGAVVFFLPMVTVYGKSEGSFVQRAAAVLVTSPTNLQHEMDAYHVRSLQDVLAIQADHTLEAFNIRGETSLEYGHSGPMFDFWTVSLLAMGSAAVLLRFDSSRGVLLAAWVWLALIIGSMLTTDAMFSPHIVVAIPALVMVPALMLDAVWAGLARLAGRVGIYVGAALVVVTCGLALQGNIHDYFQVHIVDEQPAGRFTLLSNYAASLVNRYRLYVIGQPDWTLKYDTPRFLVPDPDAVDVRDGALALPLSDVPREKGVAFLVENGTNDFAARMAAIRAAYPQGLEQVIYERPGQPTFTSYLVERSAL